MTSTIEKTVSNISEETSINQETEPKPRTQETSQNQDQDPKTQTQETLGTPDTEIKSESSKTKTSKKSLSEIIKEQKEKRAVKKEEKQRREEEKSRRAREVERQKFENKFNQITDGWYIPTHGIGYAKVSTVPHFILTNGFKLILAIFILQHYANGKLNKYIIDSKPIKQGTVVQQMVMPSETIYGIDFDENPETIESLLYLNNKNDALMNDKIKIGSKIDMKSYKKETSKSVYMIDNIIVKQR